jgi:hypothetical protein
MKVTLLVAIISVASLAQPGEALLGLGALVSGTANLIGGATNLATNLADTVLNGGANVVSGAINGVTNTAQNVQNAVTVAQAGGQFLWDNAISPALTVLQNSKCFMNFFF